MNIDVDLVIKSANFLMAVGAIIYAFFAGRQKDVVTRFETLSARQDRQENRLVRLEQAVQTMPSREDIHKLEIHMERVSGAMGRMEAVLEGNQKIMGRLEAIVSRHEDHLLKG